VAAVHAAVSMSIWPDFVYCSQVLQMLRTFGILGNVVSCPEVLEKDTQTSAISNAQRKPRY